MLRKKFKFPPLFHSPKKPIMCKIAIQEDDVCAGFGFFANYLAHKELGIKVEELQWSSHR